MPPRAAKTCLRILWPPNAPRSGDKTGAVSTSRDLSLSGKNFLRVDSRPLEAGASPTTRVSGDAAVASDGLLRRGRACVRPHRPAKGSTNPALARPRRRCLAERFGRPVRSDDAWARRRTRVAACRRILRPGEPAFHAEKRKLTEFPRPSARPRSSTTLFRLGASAHTSSWVCLPLRP